MDGEEQGEGKEGTNMYTHYNGTHNNVCTKFHVLKEASEVSILCSSITCSCTVHAIYVDDNISPSLSRTDFSEF